MTYSQWLAAVAQLKAAPDAASQGQFMGAAGAQANILQQIYAAGYSPAYFANPDYLQLVNTYADYSPQSGRAESTDGSMAPFTGDPTQDMAGDARAQAMVKAGYIVWQQGINGNPGQWQTGNLPAPNANGLSIGQIQPYDVGYPGNYVNPALWTFDPFYGAITPASNVKQSKGWAIYDAFSQTLPLLLSAPLIAPLGAALGADLGVNASVGGSLVKGIGTGSLFTAPSPTALLGDAAQLAGGSGNAASTFFSQFGPPTGAAVDASDFLDSVDQSINNAAGADFGASNVFGGDITSAFWNDPTYDPLTINTGNQTVDELLAPTDPTVFAEDDNGVLNSTAIGVNTVGDSASMTDEPGSASNNNTNTPRGGGAQLGQGAGGGAVGPSTANTPNNTNPVSYLPPNPRALQTATQALYNPQGGGLYPIVNGSANTGTSNPYGSIPVTSPPTLSSVSATSPALATASNMLQNPLVLLGMGAVALILLLK
jgi:hypothetical protein